MKVRIYSETRANGLFIVEEWPTRKLAHGPIPPDKAEEYAAQLSASIKAQAARQNEVLGAMVLTESERAFMAPKEEGWLAKRRKRRL